MQALDSIDAGAATQVIARDRELDSEYAVGLRRLLTRAVEDPRQMEMTLDAAFVLKSLERIGDHARNLARQVLGLVSEAVSRDGARYA